MVQDPLSESETIYRKFLWLEKVLYCIIWTIHISWSALGCFGNLQRSHGQKCETVMHFIIRLFQGVF